MDSQKPAFPHLTDGGFTSDRYGGLTKREYIAAMALQGVLASLNNALQVPTKDIRELVKAAIEATDILIDELGG